VDGNKASVNNKYQQFFGISVSVYPLSHLKNDISKFHHFVCMLLAATAQFSLPTMKYICFVYALSDSPEAAPEKSLLSTIGLLTLVAGSACWCCHLQWKNCKVARYKHEPRDDTASDSEYEDDDDDDDDEDENPKKHSREPKPPSKPDSNVNAY